MIRSQNMDFKRACASVGIMAALMLVCVVVYGTDPQIPLVFGCAAAALIAASAGYTWEDIKLGMVKGVAQAIEAVFILLLIGMLVGIWVAAGTVPSMIFYGLTIVDARFFLVTTMAVCSLVAFAIGSWGTVGTVGLAFMGIGLALELPAPLVAGCVVSGAYFGEIISPLSDATNLAAAVVGRDVFAVVRRVLPLAIVGLVLTEIIYFALGLCMGSSGDVQASGGVEPLLAGLKSSFAISPVALLPMLVMGVCIAAKVPAMPSMIIGSLAGMVVAVPLQGASLGDLLTVSFAGYTSATGNGLLDELLSTGGLSSMMYAISVIIIAMAFGGLMQATGQMEALVRPVTQRIERLAALNSFTTVMCVCMNALLPDQYLGISVPGQMLSGEYDKRGFGRDELARVLLGGGAVTSPLVPWNTCGVYCLGILGVSALHYAPFAVFDIVMPLLVVASSFVVARKRAVAPVVQTSPSL